MTKENELLQQPVIDESIKSEYERALAAAQEFHPVTAMYINNYTGEVSRYKTPDNYVPDVGVSCGSPDLCHTEDHVSIAQMYERLARMKALSIQDSDFDLDEDKVSVNDLDEDTLSDIVANVDDPSDYANFVEPFYEDKYGTPSEQSASDSAAKKAATESKKEDEAPEVAEDE